MLDRDKKLKLDALQGIVGKANLEQEQKLGLDNLPQEPMQMAQSNPSEEEARQRIEQWLQQQEAQSGSPSPIPEIQGPPVEPQQQDVFGLGQGLAEDQKKKQDLDRLIKQAY